MLTELPIYNQLFVILINLTAIWLCYLMIKNNGKDSLTKIFLAMAISMFCWVNFSFLARILAHSNPNFAIVSLKIAWFATPFLFVFLYFFIINLIKRQDEHRTLTKYVIIGALIIAIMAGFTDLVISGTTFVNIYYTIIYGKAMYFYLGVGLSLFAAPIYFLSKEYSGLTSQVKEEIRFILLGIFVFYVLNIIFNVVLPVGFRLNNLYFIGDYSTIILLGCIAYAILKHGLFNTKMIASESIVIALSIGLFAEIFNFNSLIMVVTQAIIWILATYGGYQLIKSVKIEIKQREDLAVLAKQLEDANSHLKEIDKLKDDFLSMASHELNTPIAAIEGYLSMILQEGMGGKIPDKAREYLQTVFTSSQRLASLVKDLLNVSRIESGRIHIIYEQKQITAVIDQAIMEVMSKAREAKHTLTFEKPIKPIPLTYFDVTRVTEIMINMLGNSIKYTPPGGKITVRTVSDGKKIVVSVEDNGKGIPKERVNAVFEKFTQVDVMKDEVKGTGLGMYIAKKFIELMNGQIWFQSPGEGKGTTFYISLPVLAEKPADPHEGEGGVLH